MVALVLAPRCASLPHARVEVQIRLTPNSPSFIHCTQETGHESPRSSQLPFIASPRLADQFTTHNMNASDDDFGPQLEGSFDFTLLFEQTVLSILPSALLLLSSPWRIASLVSKRTARIKAGLLLWTKLVSPHPSTGVIVAWPCPVARTVARTVT